MLRQSSSRNYRPKGLKLKKALQISLLVLISVWLLYQVKHSYAKKANVELKPYQQQRDDEGSEGRMIRLHRKDLSREVEADSSMLDEWVMDEETEEMELELSNSGNGNDPMDELGLEKDDNLDGGGGLKDEEQKERSQEGQERSFHADNVASAVPHDPPAAERANVSTAMHPEIQQVAQHEEKRYRDAREKSFRGDDASSGVDQDGLPKKPLLQEELKSVDRVFEGTANLSNGMAFQGPRVNGSNAFSAANSTSLKGQPEEQGDSTVVLSNQTQILANLTTTKAGAILSKLKSAPNRTLDLLSTGDQSTRVNDDIGDLNESLEIMSKAVSEDVVLQL